MLYNLRRITFHFNALWLSCIKKWTYGNYKHFSFLFSGNSHRLWYSFLERRIDDFKKEEAVIVGDSLTSDIKGGIAVGIKTVWYNPCGKAASTDLLPTAEISSLAELVGVLEKM